MHLGVVCGMCAYVVCVWCEHVDCNNDYYLNYF